MCSVARVRPVFIRRQVQRNMCGLVLAIATIGFTPSTWADALQTGEILSLSGRSGAEQCHDNFDVLVEADGRITVFGVPGVANGATFYGVRDLFISTGTLGDDVVNMVIESADLNVSIDTGVSGSDSVFIDMVTPLGNATAAPSIKVGGNSRKNIHIKLASAASLLMLKLATPIGSNSSLDLQQKTGKAVLSLNGELRELKTRGRAAIVVNGNLLTKTTKEKVEGNGTGEQPIQSGLSWLQQAVGGRGTPWQSVRQWW